MRVIIPAGTVFISSPLRLRGGNAAIALEQRPTQKEAGVIAKRLTLVNRENYASLDRHQV
jgi:hypothetical protein